MTVPPTPGVAECFGTQCHGSTGGESDKTRREEEIRQAAQALGLLAAKQVTARRMEAFCERFDKEMRLLGDKLKAIPPNRAIVPAQHSHGPELTLTQQDLNRLPVAMGNSTPQKASSSSHPSMPPMPTNPPPGYPRDATFDLQMPEASGSSAGEDSLQRPQAQAQVPSPLQVHPGANGVESKMQPGSVSFSSAATSPHPAPRSHSFGASSVGPQLVPRSQSFGAPVQQFTSGAGEVRSQAQTVSPRAMQTPLVETLASSKVEAHPAVAAAQAQARSVSPVRAVSPVRPARSFRVPSFAAVTPNAPGPTASSKLQAARAEAARAAQVAAGAAADAAEAAQRATKAAAAVAAAAAQCIVDFNP
eukprot:gnl/MRDRNA2_/MRDRNA2_79043_c1_seq1.p1 gnl/MRDRNA2_/MRDRNA2_79043_c1~~gnl/MRDRNA2_/MRDRNA2_79043_c1_seq1.p1  ORF type:complete len:361 (+),score=89.05 gnl/MRDRNA2_/MRDRNA2_79043_c1_seq1:93-1175(+)